MPVNIKFWKTVAIAWILFIGIDFLFHSAILTELWNDEVTAIKSKEQLFLLIPAGYGSFLLLTILVGYVYTRIFTEAPTLKQSLNFILIFGALFSLSNLLALYSYVEIPLKHLVAFNLVYFLEIAVVVLVFHRSGKASSLKRMILFAILTFFLLVILGITIQNLFPNS